MYGNIEKNPSRISETVIKCKDRKKNTKKWKNLYKKKGSLMAATYCTMNQTTI